MFSCWAAPAFPSRRTVHAVNGLAAFADLFIDRPGADHVLVASIGDLSVDSAPLIITPVRAPGDLDKSGEFTLADLVLGCRVLAGLAQFP